MCLLFVLWALYSCVGGLFSLLIIAPHAHKTTAAAARNADAGEAPPQPALRPRSGRPESHPLLALPQDQGGARGVGGRGGLDGGAAQQLHQVRFYYTCTSVVIVVVIIVGGFLVGFQRWAFSHPRTHTHPCLSHPLSIVWQDQAGHGALPLVAPPALHPRHGRAAGAYMYHCILCIFTTRVQWMDGVADNTAYTHTYIYIR